MRINKIELYNIGSYEGFNEFDVKSQGLNGNIVVIGGKNGAGKTTLFTAIKLCLYGYKEAGYQAMNSFYKKEIKKLINDRAKAENNGDAYVLLDLEILNGQEWDQYTLKREWSIEGQVFEIFSVRKSNRILGDEEVIDFDNYLMNLLPPELFELYFFDGEQIADYFLDDSNSERVKNAFLTICGYDTFEIIYRNFIRIGKQQGEDSSVLNNYFIAEELLHKAENKVKSCDKDIQRITEEIEVEEGRIHSLERIYRTKGGVSAEEWNQKLLDLRTEERIREEKNAWVKNAVNDIIPYVILKNELIKLQSQMNQEKEVERDIVLKDSLFAIIPDVIKSMQEEHPELNSEFQKEFLELLVAKTNHEEALPVLNLSKEEYVKLTGIITNLLNQDKNQIVEARVEIKKSISRSQSIREVIDNSNMEGIDSYLEEKENSINRKLKLVNSREQLLQQRVQNIDELEKERINYAKVTKELEKQFKSESIAALTAKAVMFLETLQDRLYKAEIEKVKILFMDKMHQLMRKEQFIDLIEIDGDFNIHVYKSMTIDIKGLQEKVKANGNEAYYSEYGEVHCKDLLKKTFCTSLNEFLTLSSKENETVDVLMEFDKTTMSKGEKQVFIMALYWSIMQLCKKDIPFIIDTPFARIDTEHREHITEHFFKELKGQIFIFSTDEEITERHLKVIGSDLGGKFLIENMNNTKTSIIAGKYFGE